MDSESTSSQAQQGFPAALAQSLLLATMTGGAAVASASVADDARCQPMTRDQESVLRQEMRPAAAEEAVRVDLLRGLAPLDVLLPPQRCLDAIAAHSHRRHRANNDEEEGEGEGGGGEEVVADGALAKPPSAVARVAAGDGGGDALTRTEAVKRARTCEATICSPRPHAQAMSPPSPQPSVGHSAFTAPTDADAPGRVGHRSPSRSPPPPALRNQTKNSFAFRVRVASHNGGGQGDDPSARPRSPLPPRSTAGTAHAVTSSRTRSPPPAVDVDDDGTILQKSAHRAPHPTTAASIPNVSGHMNAADDCRSSASALLPPHQPHPVNVANLKQTTLDFGHVTASSASFGFHYGPGRHEDLSRGGHAASGAVSSAKRFAPGGHNDAVYNNGAGSGDVSATADLAQQQQQQRKTYFGAAPRGGADPSLPPPPPGFVSAGEQLLSDIKAGRAPAMTSSYVSHRSPALGLRRGSFQSPFQQQQQPPSSSDTNLSGLDESRGGVSVNKVIASVHARSHGAGDKASKGSGKKVPSGHSDDDGDGVGDADQYPASLLNPDGTVPDILKPLDPKLVAQVAMEILERGAGARQVGWEDIAGLEHAKSSVEEAIIWPLKRPDLFVGLRDPPRGLLLFGPPGTGKTMIARAIANRAGCTFMNISSSSLMSKWMGDGEKLVRCMFAVATVKQPSVIFIDEIDSLLSMRGEGEQDSVRRVKTEFLVQLDGVATDRGDRVLLIGATNRPDELDEAARRRMEKRLYIPLPDAKARFVMVERLLASLSPGLPPAPAAAVTADGAAGHVAGGKGHSLQPEDLDYVVSHTEGYSGADLKQVCREAAMGPFRDMTAKELSHVDLRDLRPIDKRDFKQALRRIKPSVSGGEVGRYVDWNNQYGSFAEHDGSDGDDRESSRDSSA